jgi:hypothetical protein
METISGYIRLVISVEEQMQVEAYLPDEPVQDNRLQQWLDGETRLEFYYHLKEGVKINGEPNMKIAYLGKSIGPKAQVYFKDNWG